MLTKSQIGWVLSHKVKPSHKDNGDGTVTIREPWWNPKTGEAGVDNIVVANMREAAIALGYGAPAWSYGIADW